MRKVVIGIQARSTSTRLPNKATALIGSKRVLDHVIDSCKSAIRYLDNYKDQNGFICELVLLVPTGDRIKKEFQHACEIIEGDEHDVLSRYKLLLDKKNPDFICRVTGDCPFLPSKIISKMIRRACDHALDYISNVNEDTRTAIDGVDCEVISSKSLKWLLLNAKTPSDREHVTTALRREKPLGFDFGEVIDVFDFSSFKLSIDTEEDLKRAQELNWSFHQKISKAYKKFGKHRVWVE